MTDTRRRQIIKGLMAASTVNLLSCRGIYLSPSIQLSDYPFKLGVASGELSSRGCVLWTRIAPEPLTGGGAPEQDIPVRWEIGADESMSRVLRSGQEKAGPAWGHSIHLEFNDLEPGREYFYRFYAAGEASPVGRVKTLPRQPQQVRLAIGSCQHIERGYFGAYEHIINDDPDFVLFMGDYIYEHGGAPNAARRHQRGETITLEDYRVRLGEYRLDPHLQEAHRLFPWVVTWDDHEVDNDYANLDNQDWASHAEFAKRRRAAYQAYYEHMPLKLKSRPAGHSAQIYRSLEFGGLGQLLVTDGRQYRSPQACREPGVKPGRLLDDSCSERLQPDRTYLGKLQELWVDRKLKGSPHHWNLIAQPQLFTPLFQLRDNLPMRWSDDWNGYPAAQKRMTETLIRHQVSNPVILGGDIHSFWATQVPSDPDNPESKPIAAEFVTTAITSNGPPYDYFMSLMPRNPHVHYFESRYRGYTLCEFNRQRWLTRCYAVDREAEVNPSRQELAAFRIRSDEVVPERI